MAEEDVNESEDTATEGEEGEDGKAKGGLNKKLLMIILPILLLGIGAGLFFTGVIGGGDDVEVEAPEKTEEEIAAEEEEAKNANAGFYALPDLIVNLSSAQGTRFLKLKVQLEIADQTKLPEIEAITPRVIDQFQTYLREMRVEDLRGSAGIYRLRQELLYRVNIAAHPVKVNDVLFQEMLIQ